MYIFMYICTYMILIIIILKGSIFQILSYNPSLYSFSGITQLNTGNISNMRNGGLIMK